MEARYEGKTIVLVSLLVGFGIGTLLSLKSARYTEEPAINMRASMGLRCHQVPAISVNAMQNTLRKNGIPSSPMEKFALTSFASLRDPSLKAQAKEEFSKLDLETQSKLKKLSKTMVVRAGAFDPTLEAGVSAPLGFWDPAGFMNDPDEEKFLGYRRFELKHGRVCMQASLGLLVSEKFHPIFDNWNDGAFVSAINSHYSETAVANFWPAFWIMTAGHEAATTLADYEGKEIFDYGFDPFKLRPEDPEELKKYQTMELNHGRWAMITTAGIIAQELVTGQPVV